MDLYTIILADNQLLVREGIRKIINSTPGLAVIGDVGDGIELLEIIKKSKPDMVILDPSIPRINGIEAAREIQTIYPEVKIIFLSLRKNRKSLSMALKIGVRGYLVKEDTSMDLLDAIKTVREGQTYFSNRIVKDNVNEIIVVNDEPLNSLSGPLSQRERQVLTLIADGRTDNQIADLLSIRLRTVQRHHFNIRSKLGIKHTAELVKYAISMGYDGPLL